MEEIVAFRFGSIITNQVSVIKLLVENQNFELISRMRMQFMSSFDLGQHWDNMATAPTLFCVERDDNGNIVQLIPAMEAER